MHTFPFTILGLFAAFQKILDIYVRYLDGGASEVLKDTNRMLGVVFRPLYEPIQTLFERLFVPFFPNFELLEPWSAIFIFMFLYISPQASDALRGSDFGPDHKIFRAKDGTRYGVYGFAIRLLAGIIATSVCITVPNWVKNTSLDETSVIILSVAVGMIIYRIGFAAQFALDSFRGGRDFTKVFAGKFFDIWILILFFSVLLNVNLIHIFALDQPDLGVFGFLLVMALLISTSIFHFLLSKEATTGQFTKTLFSRKIFSARNSDGSEKSGHFINARRIFTVAMVSVLTIPGLDILL